MKKIRLFLGMAILAVLFSACSAAQPSATQVPATAVALASATTAFTETALPSQTATATCTSTATLAPTLTLTIGPTQTPTLDFSLVKLVSAGMHPLGMQIVFFIPGLQQLLPLKAVIEGRNYKCLALEGAADKLMCYGQMMKTPRLADVAFYSDSSNQLVYQTKLNVPDMNYATALPLGDPRTWCPDRGTNITCETECRLGPDGPCKVETCFDACGYYYSDSNCPPDMKLPVPMSNDCK